MKNHKKAYYPRCGSTGKVRYPNDTEANKSRTYLIKTGKATVPLRSYYCNDCKGVHLGQNSSKWGAA